MFHIALHEPQVVWYGPVGGKESMSTRELVIQVLDQLPEDAEIEDVIERLYFVQKLRLRLAQDGATESFTQEEAKRRMSRWLQ
jgi:hypothetical protein